jgi:uncharacterized protein (TIGR00369 family)
MSDQSRTRTISWADPMQSAMAARGMSGLAFLQAIAAGELPPPPIFALMGGGISEVAEGRVVFTLDPAEYHYNPIGSVHGGVISTLCDSAMACAIQTRLPSGTLYTTLELKVNFLRPLSVTTGRVACIGTVLHIGSRVATAECKLIDEAGKLYAHGTTTCMVLGEARS